MRTHGIPGRAIGRGRVHRGSLNQASTLHARQGFVLCCPLPVPAFRSAFRQAPQGRETRPALALPKCLGRPASLESSRRGWLCSTIRTAKELLLWDSSQKLICSHVVRHAQPTDRPQAVSAAVWSRCREPHGRPGVLSGTLSARQAQRLLVATGRFVRLPPLMGVGAARSNTP